MTTLERETIKQAGSTDRVVLLYVTNNDQRIAYCCGANDLRFLR